ncbi:MAG TPA: hypothetical protein VNQ76_15285 [Planctomicrobium sp.]|nr:hypothetical protein [Planctomicrobium sp.]
MPYVRRANGREKSESFRIAIRLAYYQMRRRRFYVMVQHGFPNLAIEVGASKREVQQKPLPVACGKMKFKEWAKLIQRKARGV